MHQPKIFTLAILLSAAVGMSDSYAQCSRGQGPPNRSTQYSNSLTQNAFSSPGLANVNALQMQSVQRQQQFPAMRNQQFQQIAQQRYAQQQEIQAGRLARAEAKRAKRAERIAALKARRAAEPSESAVMLASQSPARRFEGASSSNLR